MHIFTLSTYDRFRFFIDYTHPENNIYFVEIDSRDPNRVKTNECPRHFRKVIEIRIRHSTSMISNDTQSQSEHSISQYY